MLWYRFLLLTKGYQTNEPTPYTAITKSLLRSVGLRPWQELKKLADPELIILKEGISITLANLRMFDIRAVLVETNFWNQYNCSKSSNVWYQSCPSWNEFLKSLWSSGYEGWDWGNHKISRGALNMDKNLRNSILCRGEINNPNK